MDSKTAKEVEISSDSKPGLWSQPMHLINEMEHMLDSFNPRRWWVRPSSRDWLEPSSVMNLRLPNVDIQDNDDHITVRAEVPGFDKKDIHISMTDKSITLNGSSKKESKEEDGDYYRHEISSGSFTRSLMLPCAVLDNEARARLTDGLLEITIPKVEKSTRHTVEVD